MSSSSTNVYKKNGNKKFAEDYRNLGAVIWKSRSQAYRWVQGICNLIAKQSSYINLIIGYFLTHSGDLN